MMAFLPLVVDRRRNDNDVMHPFQMDTLAKQRWDELVTLSAAARHNARRRARAGAPRRHRISGLLGLLVGRSVRRTPRGDCGPGKVATLP
jgi:hypothetical protein